MIRADMRVQTPVAWTVDHEVRNANEGDTMPSVVAPRNILEVTRGGLLRVTYTFSDGDTGGYYDLTDKVVYFVVGHTRPPSRALVRRSDQAGHMEILNPRNGIVTVILPAVETAKLIRPRYEYEVWIVEGAERIPVIHAEIQMKDTVMPP